MYIYIYTGFYICEVHSNIFIYVYFICNIFSYSTKNVFVSCLTIYAIIFLLFQNLRHMLRVQVKMLFNFHIVCLKNLHNLLSEASKYAKNTIKS